MLILNDGRSELWQWDTGRAINVPADCSQVHFSNKVFGRSIDVDVVDGVAIIPDVLLQTDKELTAWAFVGTAENGYTKISKVFKVNRRNKPADYVFTPAEQTTLGEILERLDDIESAQDPDAIKNVVEDYLADNPVQVDETDPTVPEWAKQPEKPKYTAAEVGALPADTAIPKPYTLPVATAETLGGVKPVAATDDMTQPVGVDAAGALFTAPGAGGGDSSAFRLVNTIETTEEVANITLNQTDDGEPWNFQEVIMHIHVPTATTNSYVTPKVNGITPSPSFYVWSANVFHPTNASDSTITILACGDACRMNLQGRTNLGGSPYSGEAWAMGEGKFKTITEFVFAGFNISIPAGCKMLVFAR